MITLFFTKFEENKIENFEKKWQKDNFSKFLSKITTFSKFSYNFVDLAHVISYGAVAVDLVPRFIARSSATIVTTGCSVHSEVLFFFFFNSRWFYLNTDIYFVGPLGILSLCTGCIWHVLSYQAQAWSRTRIQSTCQLQLEIVNQRPKIGSG